MFSKLGKKKTDTGTPDEEEIFLISEEQKVEEEGALERSQKESTEVRARSRELNFSPPAEKLSAITEDLPTKLSSESTSNNNNNNNSTLYSKFDKIPMFSCSRNLIKTLVKFIVKLLVKLWKWASTFMIAIFFVSWFYGGIYPYIVCCIAILSLGYQISDSLIYQPDAPVESRFLVPSPSQYSLPSETVHIHTKDRVKLHAYLIKQQQGSRMVPTVIFFHGNAGNIGHRLDNTKLFFHHVKCNTLMVEYRGYGLSEGTPSEAGFYLDAQAAFEFVDERPDLDSSKIVLFGRSLGGAVAIDLASRCDYRDRVAGLIIENTFTNIPELAKKIFPFKAVEWIPKFFFKNKYDSVKKISAVVCPVLFICGDKDELIPSHMTSELFNKCSTEHKECKRFPTGGHNDTWLCSDYPDQLRKFIRETVSRPRPLIHPSTSSKMKSYRPYDSDNIV